MGPFTAMWYMQPPSSCQNHINPMMAAPAPTIVASMLAAPALELSESYSVVGFGSYSCALRPNVFSPECLPTHPWQRSSPHSIAHRVAPARSSSISEMNANEATPSPPSKKLSLSIKPLKKGSQWSFTAAVYRSARRRSTNHIPPTGNVPQSHSPSPAIPAQRAQHRTSRAKSLKCGLPSHRYSKAKRMRQLAIV
ncbi:hypothetical protein P154DRAFT_581303 [Amniculicola lignicola CBS 123094]|uniref:Uncharacterized protein n=1 Tax=Amniculicola lignicola CBS 123094 TaxID=1392246 RepID=A0A6A5WBJ2_9PLEO|nr:hypothetical protein P154DRAFT_581303 [Amniculicola lignicola CBS 123094]